MFQYFKVICTNSISSLKNQITLHCMEVLCRMLVMQYGIHAVIQAEGSVSGS